MFTANRRIYLDKDRKVVEADNPARATLLIAEGQSMPDAEAREYGLIGGDAAEAEGDGPAPKKATKRGAGPSEDK